ncbi:MAG: 1-deoxy-D-xylulose-5-phosphate reductoisomerase [Lentisphaeria bacterium]
MAIIDMSRQSLTILGASGSIGVSTLDVVRMHPDRFTLFALTAHKNITLLNAQCLEFHPQYAVVSCDRDAVILQNELLSHSCKTEVLWGSLALEEVAQSGEVDTVMAAIVGAAGLPPTMAAVRAGKRVLLANKESLVMSGRLFTREVKACNARILPIDSEHNAIFQCMPSSYQSLKLAGISKILLTGSGGPFRTLELDQLAHVTPEQACNHPNWSMGQKISVDSATMMNKGLEYIEARWLFNASPCEIEVVVHPQSIIHSMVEYLDGSVLAQMGLPDMRTPIAYGLGWPERIASGVQQLDFARLGGLTFEAPDYARFPCLKLAVDALEAGSDYSAALNAANEVAVDLFLSRQIGFGQISTLIAEVLETWNCSEPDTIDDVIDADRRARLACLQKAKPYVSNSAR